MTCDNALTFMLSADLAELAPGHPGEVGQHLEGCARCRRVAAQLRADSLQLAAAVKLPVSVVAPVRRPVPRPWMVGLAATAAVAIVMVATGGPTGDQPAGSAVKAVPEAAVATQAATPASVGTATVPRGGAGEPQRSVAQPGYLPRANPAVAFVAPPPVAAQAFEPPTPVRAVVLVATPALALTTNLDPGERWLPAPNPNVRVLPSPDPDITVLWFY
jgi:hypothetical protein